MQPVVGGGRFRGMAAFAAFAAFERRSRWAAVSAKQAVDEAPDWSGYLDAELIHITVASDGVEFYRGVG